MDILWLQNTVSRQFIVNAVTTLSEQLITISNVLTDLVLYGDNATVTIEQDNNTPTNRCNETLFTQNLINSIRGNVAYTHRHGSSGDTDNYLYQQKCAQSPVVSQSLPSLLLSPQQPHQQWYSSPKSTIRMMKNTKPIGNIVNLHIEKCGTISTYDCDSNYTTTYSTTATKRTRTTITCHSNNGSVNNVRTEHSVKNDKSNYNNNNKKNDNNNVWNKRNHISTTTTSPTSTSSRSNRMNRYSPMMDIASISAKPVYHTKFEKRTQCSQSQWWKNLVIVICYLFLLSSSLRICSANKHEGNFHLNLYHVLALFVLFLKFLRSIRLISFRQDYFEEIFFSQYT